MHTQLCSPAWICLALCDLQQLAALRALHCFIGGPDLSGRPDLSTAQVALEPDATAIVDLNAATVQGSDGKRITLADILRDDGTDT